jgi:O-acetyl-ADP-ribose deacetylase (regulator of RNase III)
MLEIVRGDLLLATEKYIAHQCNCLTQGAAGVAKAIFDKFPYADTYSNRVEPDVMGTIKILGNGQDQRYVINMFAQYYPGRSDYSSPSPKTVSAEIDDTASERRHNFYRCLLRIIKIENLESIAFPWKIGCGIAGGDWEYYLGTLTNFAKYVKEQYDTRVVIYQREGDE